MCADGALPHGVGWTLRMPLPDALALSGRLMEIRLSYGVARLICESPDVRRPQGDDTEVALGGSQTFSAISLDANREIGVIVADSPVVAQLASVAQGDWDTAQATK